MIDALDGVIRFNPVYLIINISFASFFIISWYKQYRSTGINLDIWVYNMLLIFILPFIIMYPFATSDYNILYVGSSGVDGIISGIDEAYIVSIIGFLSMFIGKFYCDRFGINKIISFIFYNPFVNTIGLYYSEIILSKKVSRSISIIYIFILTIFVSFILSRGLISNPRGFFMENTQFRPIYGLIISLFSIVFGVLSTRILQFNSIIDKLLLIPIAIFGFLLGVRAPVIFQILGFGLMYVIYKGKGYISIYKMLLFVITILLLIIFLVLMRNSDVSTSRSSLNSTSIFWYEIFYGNTFSDIRDFSLIIGYWDGVHLWGMSYISAFVSFIPSYLLSFREQWGIGRITVNMLGFDPTVHPGVRPGFFGEMYLNFGIVGVIVLGFIWAQVIQNVNKIIKKSVHTNNVVLGNSALISASFVWYLSNTAGFFEFYVLFIVLFILYLCTRIRV